MSTQHDAKLLWSLLHNGKAFSGDAETLRFYRQVIDDFDARRDLDPAHTDCGAPDPLSRRART